MAYETLIQYAQTVMEGTTIVQGEAMTLITQLPMCEYDMHFAAAAPSVELIRSWMPSISSYASAIADELDPMADPELWGAAHRLVGLVTAMQTYVDVLVPTFGQIDDAALIANLASDARSAATEIVTGAGTAMAEAAVQQATAAAQDGSDEG